MCGGGGCVCQHRHIDMQVPMETERGCQIPKNWSPRQLWVIQRRCRESSLDYLQEQRALAEPSPRSPRYTLKGMSPKHTLSSQVLLSNSPLIWSWSNYLSVALPSGKSLQCRSLGREGDSSYSSHNLHSLLDYCVDQGPSFWMWGQNLRTATPPRDSDVVGQQFGLCRGS